MQNSPPFFMEALTYVNRVHPIPHVEEGAFVGAVVQQQHAVHLPEVALGQATEPLLARGVPQLQTEYPAVHGDGFRMEVDAECGSHVANKFVLAQTHDEAGLPNRSVSTKYDL